MLLDLDQVSSVLGLRDVRLATEADLARLFPDSELGAMAPLGAGPIGLATLVLAQLYSPAELILIDVDENRLETARRLGATATIRSADGQTADKVLAHTARGGVDVAIEAVGIPETFELCQAIVAAGGHLANVGVHGRGARLHLDRLWPTTSR